MLTVEASCTLTDDFRLCNVKNFPLSNHEIELFTFLTELLPKEDPVLFKELVVSEDNALRSECV